MSEYTIHHDHVKYCPYCEHKLDAATGGENSAGPKKGDFSLCFYCANCLIFTDNAGSIRKVTEADLRDVDMNVKINLLMMQIKLRAKIRREQAEQEKESAA